MKNFKEARTTPRQIYRTANGLKNNLQHESSEELKVLVDQTLFQFGLKYDGDIYRKLNTGEEYPYHVWKALPTQNLTQRWLIGIWPGFDGYDYQFKIYAADTLDQIKNNEVEPLAEYEGTNSIDELISDVEDAFKYFINDDFKEFQKYPQEVWEQMQRENPDEIVLDANDPELKNFHIAARGDFDEYKESLNESEDQLKTKKFGDWAVVFWKKGSKVLHIAQNQGEPNTTNYWMVGITTRQFDYESGWLPNKEWTSAIKGHFSKDKAIQLAKENAEKALNESKYVDKDIEPLRKKLSHHSDDGFIDFCTAKVLDDLNKGNKKKLDFYEFWDWAAEVGSKDIVELIYNDFKNDKLAKDSAVCRFYKTYEDIKDLSLKDPKKFIKQYGWAYEDKIKDKSLKDCTNRNALTESEGAMKLYKGIVKGRQRQLKTEGTGMWFSSSKDVAKTYSDEVETWELDTSLPLKAARIDCHQKSWNEINTDAYARKYKDYDVIFFKDIVDVGPLVLKYTKKDDKRTVKEAFKDFTADTIVVNNPSCLKKVQTEILKESTETLKHFDKLYHGSKNGELRSDEKHKYNCLYVTPVFAYAALYSTGSDSEHGCVFEMQPVRDLNIFDANDEGALDKLKAKVEELNPDNALVRRINWEELKTKDWSTVCFRKDEIRDELLLKAVKELGYDGYVNHEWDEDCAQFYAEGSAGCGKVTNSVSIGIFDENLLEITDEKYFDDYSDDDLFNECHQADEDFFVTFLQDGGYNDFYYDTAEEAANFAAENLLFLDVDEVNDLIEDYANLESED